MLQYRIDLKPGHRNEGDVEVIAPNADAILEKYLRFQEAAALEKHWTNERLGWLFTPQSILFAALGFTFSDKLQLDQHSLGIIRAVIPLVAIGICIVAFVAVLAACRMHYKWTKEMKGCKDQYEKATGRGSDLTFGSKPYWPADWARWSTLLIPLIFFFAWVAIFWWAGLYRGFCPS
jgi:hypothetical protein